MMKIHIPTVVGAVLLGLVMTAAACSDGGRPSASEWESAWTATVEAMPTLEQMGDPPDRDTCSHALGVLRSGQTELIPTPDPVLDATVQEWLAVAEDAMFECPPTSAELPNLEVAYDELGRLAAEIDVVLEIDLAGD
jgi:hypothetical protein